VISKEATQPEQVHQQVSTAFVWVLLGHPPGTKLNNYHSKNSATRTRIIGFIVWNDNASIINLLYPLQNFR
jgi:hypothetical protein